MLIPAFIFVPAITVIFISLLKNAPSRVLDTLVVLCSAFLAGLSIFSLFSFDKGSVLAFKVGDWPNTLSPSLLLDGLSVYFLIIANAIFFLVSVFSVEYMGVAKDKWKYYALLFSSILGLNGVLLSSDLLSMFIFAEIASISGYALVSFGRQAEDLEASLKYAVLGTLSSMLVLFGIALVYSKISSLNFHDIAQMWNSGPKEFQFFVFAVFIAGFGFKAAIVPLHAWVPDAYSRAPSSVSAFFAGAMCKVLGIYLLLRVFYNVFGINPAVQALLVFLGSVSMIFAVVLAFYQWNFKRLLSYHSISQLGYIVLGIGIGTPLGLLGALLHVLNHSVFKSLLFLNAGSIEHATGSVNLKELGGLSKKMPVTYFSSMIASMSISGVPPLNGFWSKVIIIAACVQVGSYWAAAVAVITAILTLASFLKVQRHIFSGNLAQIHENIKEAPFLMLLPMVVLALICVFGVTLLIPGVYERFVGDALSSVNNGLVTPNILGAYIK